MLTRSIGVLAVLVLAIGCKDAAGPGATIVAGDGLYQFAKTGQALDNPFTVHVVDAEGHGVKGATVEWSVVAGGGTVSQATSTTPSGGAAQTLYTAGPAAGTHIVRATLKNGSASVEFPVEVGAAANPTLLAELPANPLVHDTFVRDGIVFMCAWNTTGLRIYDVGNGIAGGTPSSPKLVSSLVIPNLATNGTQIHNAWWFWNPTNGEKKYLFLGEEGAGVLGQSSTGDIHVVDVSDLAHPQKVAFYHMSGTPSAGTHNFWMDESAQILYAAYYNGGVVALDVSGTLTGDLASREKARINPAGALPTYVWGVQASGGSIYAADILNGLYRLTFTGTSFTSAGTESNVTERYTSDLWVHGSWAYTGTYGGFVRKGNYGNVLKVWQLPATGVPVLKDSVVVGAIQTISDVQVSSDGKLLVFSAEHGATPGLYFFSLVADAGKPKFLTRVAVTSGVHTATIADIGDKRYVFAAKDNGSNPATSSAMQIWDITAVTP